jgi:type VI protein secretion system component VasF
MSELHRKITVALLAVQALLEEDLAEHEAVQSAFNALCCAIDDELMK